MASDMKLFYNNIPMSHIFIKDEMTFSPLEKESAQLVAPPGVSIDRLSTVVANQVARTIIHEAAHGKRWAQEYLSGNLKLNDMSRSEEESFAERAEDRSGLQTNLMPDILDTSETEDQMSEETVLSHSISIANSNYDMYIPRSSVKSVNLHEGAWGQFDMVQGGDTGPPQQDVVVAWNENERKLMIDVGSIIREYNRALSSSEQFNTQQNMTNQTDGMEPDLSGVSRDGPLQTMHAPPVGSVSAVPDVPSK